MVGNGCGILLSLTSDVRQKADDIGFLGIIHGLALTLSLL